MARLGEVISKTYPQELSALILAELKRQVESFLGHEVNKAVIAIPAHFGENQRRATIEAAGSFPKHARWLRLQGKPSGLGAIRMYVLYVISGPAHFLFSEVQVTHSYVKFFCLFILPQTNFTVLSQK